MKPSIVYFYKSDDAIKDLLSSAPFYYDMPVKIKKSNDESFYDYEHFTLRCYKASKSMDCFKGVRAWIVLVEDIVYDELEKDRHDMLRLEVMMTPYRLLGGQPVRVTHRKDLINDFNPEV